MFPRRIDGLSLVSLGLLVFMLMNVLQDRGMLHTALAAADPASAPVTTPASVDGGAQVGPDPAQIAPAWQIAPGQQGNDPNVGGGILLDAENEAINSDASGAVRSISPEEAQAFLAPYDSYSVTQGLHGYSYGHAAVDLSAGDGETILSPIAGEITDYYVDEWNNTTLVIENARYKVTLLHGLYTVSIGDRVQIGDPIGAESNQGNTYDAYGNYCGGSSNCGYHTHINVFDKDLGQNVNPLNLMGD